LFQVADIEQSGIPIVSLIYEDQSECFRQAALLEGSPLLRYVAVSRTMQGPEDVERFLPEVFNHLTRPLTEEEKNCSGKYTINQDRILFEGTLEEAEKFYMQTERHAKLRNAPIAKYTDGLPIVVPTEERVAEMLKGTSHKPDEIITLQSDHGGFAFQSRGSKKTKGTPVVFRPVDRTATVEQVAVNAVMAGCTPEMFPVVLAIAEAGGGGGGDGRGSVGFCISGPIAKEIGMNFDVGLMGPGNPANRSLARAGELMWRNFGGNIPNVTNCGVMGAPLFNALPEDLDSLPPGWKSLGEEYDFKRDDSILYTFNFGRGGSTNIHRTEFSPGGYRAFVKSGHGGIARRLGVKGVPGPKNWLEYLIPGIWHDREGGITFFMLPQMAQALYDAGFKTKDAVYEWIYKASFTTMANYRTHSWVDVNTNSWLGIEPRSGKPYKELPDDYAEVSFVRDPYENCIIVTGSGEEYPQWVGARRPGTDPVYSIDAWR
jgi:hypothetical protein